MLTPAPVTVMPDGMGRRESFPVRHLCELAITFQRMHRFTTPLGMRITAVAGAGSLRGAALTGTVAPGGGDWLLVGSDGVARLDIRATVLSNDAAAISLTGLGRVHLSPVGSERFLTGETVTADQMCGRASVLFETGAEPYAWMNSVVAAGVITELAQTHICYDLYGLD
jgi:Protein of unknown function (DUF3237)